MKCEHTEKISYSSFGKKGSSKPKLSQVYQVPLLGIDGKIHNLSAISIDQICNPLLRQAVPAKILSKIAFDEINNIMADDFTTERTINIDLLIGLDYLWQFIDPLDCG